jgi:hypothetical protein
MLYCRSEWRSDLVGLTLISYWLSSTPYLQAGLPYRAPAFLLLASRNRVQGQKARCVVFCARILITDLK